MAMTAEERKVYMHKYYEDNKSYIQKYKRAWYLKHKDEVDRRSAEYRRKRAKR